MASYEEELLESITKPSSTTERNWHWDVDYCADLEAYNIDGYIYLFKDGDQDYDGIYFGFENDGLIDWKEVESEERMRTDPKFDGPYRCPWDNYIYISIWASTDVGDLQGVIEEKMPDTDVADSREENGTWLEVTEGNCQAIDKMIRLFNQMIKDTQEMESKQTSIVEIIKTLSDKYNFKIRGLKENSED